jgi:hypothetical protein
VEFKLEMRVYTYTGLPFTVISGAPSGVSARTGSFTLSNPLGANFCCVVTPLSYSFTDGATSMTQANSVFNPQLQINTGTTGALSGWTWFINIYSPNFTSVGAVVAFDSQPGFDSSVYFLNGGQIGGEAYNRFAIGTWTARTTTVTPEPSSLILLGSGLLGMLGAARRKFLR